MKFEPEKKKAYKEYSEFSPYKVDVGGLPALAFMDREGEIMSKEDFHKMMELATRFYQVDGVDAWIEQSNQMQRWELHPLLHTKIVDGKRVLPEPKYTRKTFRKNLKQDWGFSCAWCKKKVSSKTDEDYYRVNEYSVGNGGIEGQCCSEECATHLWYEGVIEWIIEEKLTDTFHTDKHIKA